MNEIPSYNEDQAPIDLRLLIAKYLRYWPLYIFAISICCAGAFLYLRLNDQLTYTVYAKLLIKDEKSAVKTENAGGNDQTAKLVSNEIEILKSRGLMERVVKHLNLWISYETPGKFHPVDIYRNSPVTFQLLMKNESYPGTTLNIIIKDNEHFILKKANSKTLLPFNRPLKSGFGTWKLSPNRNLTQFIGKTISVHLSSPETAADTFSGRFNATLSAEQATVVDLFILDPVPQRGKDILNRLITEYNLVSLDEKNTITENTLRFIDQRLTSLKQELTAIEKKAEEFKSSRKLTDISSESQMFLNNVKENDSRMNEVKVQLQLIRDIERYVKSPSGAINPPVTVGIPDAGLTSLVRQLTDAQLEKEKLLATVPAGHPIFTSLNREITGLKKKISDNIAGIKRSLLVTQRQFQNYNNKFESSIEKLPGQEREFISIKRQQSIKEELYVYLLKRKEEAAVIYASTLIGSRTVDQAYVGGAKGVNKGFTYALAFALGLLLPTGFVFGKDLISNKVGGSEEIENLLPVPILGELMFIKAASASVISNGIGTMIAEQFRTLRINLKYIHGKSGLGKITLITSGIPGEGKSFVARNLAASIAATGRKTVILEVDFRNPKVSKSFDLTGHVGLSNYLAGEISKQHIIQYSGTQENLYVIGTGPLPANPTELLEQPRMEELLDWLRTEFDEILLDTPPLHVVSDAMILSSYSDANLYVIRHEYTHRTDLEFIRQLYQQQKLNKLHLVYNATDMKGRYGYRKNYYYQYYSQTRLLPGPTGNS